jgi:hypothetical protein
VKIKADTSGGKLSGLSLLGWVCIQEWRRHWTGNPWDGFTLGLSQMHEQVSQLDRLRQGAGESFIVGFGGKTFSPLFACFHPEGGKVYRTGKISFVNNQKTVVKISVQKSS